MESSMSCGQMLKFSLSKLIMEFIGTMFLTLFFTGSPYSVSVGGVTYSAGINSISLLLSLWILTIFFWKISGSHFNPAVTFALMFRRDDKKLSI